MKRRIVSFVLAIVTLTSIIPSRVIAASNSAKSDAYSAYYDFLQQKVEAGSIIEPSTLELIVSSYWLKKEGVLFSRLIDLAGDGIGELFLIESHKEILTDGYHSSETYCAVWCLYTYKDGTVVKVGEESLGAVSWYLTFSKDSKGKQYFSSWSSANEIYYTINKGVLEDTVFSISFAPDWVASDTILGNPVTVTSDYGRNRYLINYEDVGKKTYMAREQELNSTVLASYSSSSGGKHHGAAVEKIPDGSIYETMKLLENDLPSGYLATYRAPSAWARTEVEKAIAAGFVPQGLQRKYSQPITRAEFCSLASQYYEKSTGSIISQRANFSDTSDVSVQKMGGMGIVTGVGDGKFNPNGLLTREAAAVILMRLAAVLGNEPTKAAPTFADNGSISTWAYEQVGQAQSIGIMSGTGNNQFAPQQPYTREQSILTILRMGEQQESVTSLELKESEVKLFVGTSKTLTPIIQTSSNTANRAITWSSSNSATASVESTTGKITAIRGGTAIITGKASNGLSVQCNVTVIQPNGKFYCELPVTVDCEYREYVMGVLSESGYGATIEITKLGEPQDAYSIGYDIECEATVTKVGADRWIGLRIPYAVEDYNGNVICEDEAKTLLGTYVDYYTQYGANVGDKVTFKLYISKYNYVEKQGKTVSVDLSKGGGYVIRFKNSY